MINRTLNRETPSWYVCQLPIVTRAVRDGRPGCLGDEFRGPAESVLSAGATQGEHRHRST